MQQSAYSPLCHPTVASSSIVTTSGAIQQSPAIADSMALEADQVAWSDQAGTTSRQPDESVHLVISATDGEETDNDNDSYVSAVTSVAVTSVSTCQLSEHTDNTEAESLAHHQLSVSDHRHTEGTAFRV